MTDRIYNSYPLCFVGRNPNQLYLKTLRYISANGSIVSPRGLKTREISPVVTVIEKPSERIS